MTDYFDENDPNIVAVWRGDQEPKLQPFMVLVGHSGSPVQELKSTRSDRTEVRSTKRVEEDEERLVGVAEVARILNTSVRSVYRMVEEGAIPHLRLRGGIRFHRAVVLEWSKKEMLNATANKQQNLQAGRQVARGPSASRRDGAQEVPPYTWPTRPVRKAGS